jgi:hypothetical protein
VPSPAVAVPVPAPVAVPEESAVAVPVPPYEAASVPVYAPAPQYEAAPAPVYAPAPSSVPERPGKGTRKKLPLVIGVIVAVVVIAGGVTGFLVWQESKRAEDYANAQALMGSGRYEEALESFTELGDYQYSQDLAALSQDLLDKQAAFDLLEAGDLQTAKPLLESIIAKTSDQSLIGDCNNALTYIAASELFDAKDYAAAREKLGPIISADIPGARELDNKCGYALAEAELSAGHNYAAYTGFSALGDYSDAAARAETCKLPFPATGELWHNPDFYSTSSSIRIDCSNVSAAHYYKIYAGETLVAQLFINGGASHELELPAGSYTIKEATGDMWWGPDDAFGPKAHYEIMTFGDGATTYDLGDNRIVTITLNTSAEGDSVGGRNTDLENF